MSLITRARGTSSSGRSATDASHSIELGMTPENRRRLRIQNKGVPPHARSRIIQRGPSNVVLTGDEAAEPEDGEDE